MATASTAATPIFARVPGAAAAAAQPVADARRPADAVLTVNGRDHQLAFDTRTSLLDLLREHLQLSGTKKAATTVNAVLARS